MILNNQIDYKIKLINGKSHIAVSFEYNKELNERIKAISGSEWSNSLKSWLLPDSQTNRVKFRLPLKNNTDQNAIFSLINEVSEYMKLENYCHSTIRNYILHLKEFFSVISLKYIITEVDENIVEKYLLWRMKAKDVSAINTNIHISAIKFYYEKILKREGMLFNISRPTTHFEILKTFSKDKFESFFYELPTIKYRAILLVILCLDISIKKVTVLKINEIDTMDFLLGKNTNSITRQVSLNTLFFDIVKAYLKVVERQPTRFLFEGAQLGYSHNMRDIQNIFKETGFKIGLTKGSFRYLCNLFEAYFHEKEFNMIYVKELLGYCDITPKRN